MISLYDKVIYWHNLYEYIHIIHIDKRRIYSPNGHKDKISKHINSHSNVDFLHYSKMNSRHFKQGITAKNMQRLCELIQNKNNVIKGLCKLI